MNKENKTKLTEKDKLNYYLKHGKHIEESWFYIGDEGPTKK